MECKYCNATLPEDTTLCPFCGKDNAKDLTEAAEQAARDVTEEAQAEVEQAAEAVEDTAEQAAETVENAAEQAAETVENAAEQAAETVENAAEQAAETVENAAEQAAETVENAAEDAQDAVEGAEDAARETAAVIPEAIREEASIPEAPKKKKKTGKVVGIVIGCLVGLLLLAAAGYYGYYAYAHKDERSFTENLKAATDALLGRTPALVGGDDINVKTVYTDQALVAGDARLAAPIAQCGDLTLDNGTFQIYYWMQFYTFMNQYGSYASMYGLDTSLPMSEQDCMLQEGLNWEQLFVESGIDQFKEYGAVYNDAIANGYTLSQEDADNLQSMLDNLETEALNNGYPSADAYIQESFGPGVTMEDYTKFANVYYLSGCYERDLYNQVEYTDEDLAEWYENSGYAEEYGIPMDDTHNVNVRHILIQPETDDEGNATDEAKADAKALAEEILETWKKDPTEDNFASLAQLHSTDSGSAENGGLYEDVYPGQMVEAFNDWCFDPARKTGDTDIVETDYGFHVMYFVSQSDNVQWKVIAQQEYPASRISTMVLELRDKYPTTVCYNNIVLGPVDLESAE